MLPRNKSMLINRMTNKFKNALVGLISISLLECGTVNTVVRGDSITRRNLKSEIALRNDTADL